MSVCSHELFPSCQTLSFAHTLHSPFYLLLNLFRGIFLFLFDFVIYVLNTWQGHVSVPLPCPCHFSQLGFTAKRRGVSLSFALAPPPICALFLPLFRTDLRSKALCKDTFKRWLLFRLSFRSAFLLYYFLLVFSVSRLCQNRTF